MWQKLPHERLPELRLETPAAPPGCAVIGTS